MACRRDAIFCVCTGHIVETQYFAFLFWETQNIAFVRGRKIVRFYFGGDAKYCVSTGRI
jgi:hypothetical protein